MKAITTIILNKSVWKPTRVKAFDMDNNWTCIDYDFALDSKGNQEKAAYALIKKMNWNGKVIGGEVEEGKYVWVFTD